MSAIGPYAPDIVECPLMTQSGHWLASTSQRTLVVFTCPGSSPTALILPKIGSRKQFLRGRNEDVGVHHAGGLQGGST